MRVVILWVLFQSQPYPQVLGTFPSHGACVQAIYNFGAMGHHSTANHQPAMRCRQQTVSVATPIASN